MHNTYHTRIERAKSVLDDAQYVLLGGGAGLSAAAGISYSGKRFTDHFGPFIEKYGLKRVRFFSKKIVFSYSSNGAG